MLQPTHFLSILGNAGLLGCVSHLQVNRYRLDLQKVEKAKQCPRSDATTCGLDYCHGQGRCYKVSNCDEELSFVNRPTVSSENSNQLVLTMEFPEDTYFHGFELINKDDQSEQENFEEHRNAVENTDQKVRRAIPPAVGIENKRSISESITTSISFNENGSGQYFEDGQPKIFYGISSKYVTRKHYLIKPVRAKTAKITLHGEQLNRIVEENKLVFTIFGGNAVQCNIREQKKEINNENQNQDLFQCRCYSGFYGKRCNAPLSTDENHELLICDNRAKNERKPKNKENSSSNNVFGGDRVKLECDPDSIITVLFANLGRTRQMKCKDQQHSKNNNHNQKNQNNSADDQEKTVRRAAANAAPATALLEMSHINDTITRREDEISSDYDSIL